MNTAYTPYSAYTPYNAYSALHYIINNYMKKISKNKLTPQEQEAEIMIKDLIKKPKLLKASDFAVGNIVMYSYTAKTVNIYDTTPLSFILGKTQKHIYGININWIPPALRKGIMKMIFDSAKNKKNVKQGKPIEVPKMLVKKIFRMGVPAFRKYIKKRVSKRGIVIPHHMYNKVTDLRSENFTGISSQDAWKIAVSKLKKNKRKVSRK